MNFEILQSNEYLRLILIIFAFILIGNIIHFILNTYIKKITKKTKTDIDDKILSNLIPIIYIFMLFLGIYFALKQLSFFSAYSAYIDGAYFVVIVLTISYAVSRIVKILIDKWSNFNKKYQKTPQIINKITSITIYLIALLIILSHFNIEISPFIAAMGIGGLAIGLALQSTLSNLFSGLYILSDKPIRVGDFIELDNNISGFVEDIGWRSTRIRTLPNTIVIVPNSKLAESIINNDSMPEQDISVVVQCGVSYDSDLDKVEKVTIDVARKIQKTVKGAVKDFEPFIRYHTFGDSNINFSVIMRANSYVDKFLLVHEFIKELKKAYDKEGIEISYPVRKIYKQ